MFMPLPPEAGANTGLLDESGTAAVCVPDAAAPSGPHPWFEFGGVTYCAATVAERTVPTTPTSDSAAVFTRPLLLLSATPTPSQAAPDGSC